eukprot:TRINITY_DN30749_c0_g1_i1.p1 TRINITY_DN30749_c0_g1~~TRINITY_DN30749_c0_g1_i1.p1  ORF type:complete len:167 (-),score=19.54 TRINITY_DN30749_c0_g1_i1:105-578(-)
MGCQRSIIVHNMKIMETYTYPAHVNKYLALALKYPELNPGFKLYNILMMEFLKQNFNIKAVPTVEEAMAQQCWACKKIYEDPKDLKTCDCKVGKYCERKCQFQEWKVHKLLHQELRITQDVLLEIAKEEEAEEEEKLRVKSALQNRPGGKRDINRRL